MKNNKEDSLGVFLPCRKGSERVPDKNTKAFTKKGESLLGLKLQQLCKTEDIDIVVVSTNDEKVKSISENFQKIYKKIQIIDREESLSTSITKTDDLVKHAKEILNTKFIMWTHVTSPFMNEKLYKDVIKVFKDNYYSKKNKSLMTVNKLQKFIWDSNGPINYDKKVIKWPNTQTLPIYWLINSAAFISTRENYINNDDRICDNPYYYELNDFLSLDVDNVSDFEFAQMCWEFNIQREENHSLK